MSDKICLNCEYSGRTYDDVGRATLTCYNYRGLVDEAYQCEDFTNIEHLKKELSELKAKNERLTKALEQCRLTEYAANPWDCSRTELMEVLEWVDKTAREALRENEK